MMGCDIHAFGEWRGDDGNWRPTHQWDADEAEWANRIYTERDYSLFALVAGVDDCCGIAPLFPRRGIPANCCGDVRRAHEARAKDHHSATWVGLWELLEHDWTATVGRGLVPLAEYVCWMGMPDTVRPPRPLGGWALGASGVQEISEEQAMQFVGAEVALPVVLVDAAWTVPQWYIAQRFLGQVFGKLGHYGPATTRLVMWFDN
jgi:hypothetical protein